MLIAAEIIKNIAMGLAPVRRWRARRARTRGGDPAAAAADALRQLGLLERHAGPVRGRSVLEIGPGDDLLTGLAFLAAGARRYTALDRFDSAPDSPSARARYRALTAAWHGRWPASLDPDCFPGGAPVRCVAGGVEEPGGIEPHDVIFSHAVGEHVRSPAAFASLTAAALKLGGTAVHVFDFSGHAFDDPADPLRFRRYPEWMWRLMGSNRGLPNRLPFEDWPPLFAAAGLACEARDVRELRHANLRADGGGAVPSYVQEATFVLWRR